MGRFRATYDPKKEVDVHKDTLSQFQFLVDTPNPEAVDNILKQLPPEGMCFLVRKGVTTGEFIQRDGHYVVQGPGVKFLKWSIARQGYATVVE